MRTVLSEHQCRGLLIQQASYSWEAESALAECDPAVTLKYVPGAKPIQARAWFDSGVECRLGRIILTPASTNVHARAVKDEHDMRSLVLHFDPDWLNLLWQADFLRIDDIPIDLEVRSTCLEATLARIDAELRQPGLATAQMLRSLAQVLAVDLGRYVKDYCRVAVGHPRVLSRRRLQNIHDFVVNAPGAPRPGEIAAACSLSPGHLRRLFKQTTGRTLRDYIEQVQVEKARQLMQTQPDLPMKIISHRLGYRHASAFSTAYKRVTGETPCSYRNALRAADPVDPGREGQDELTSAFEPARGSGVARLNS